MHSTIINTPHTWKHTKTPHLYTSNRAENAYTQSQTLYTWAPGIKIN